MRLLRFVFPDLRLRLFGIDDALLAVGGSIVSGIINNESADDRQQAANEFSAQQYASRYQTTVKDMEAAGLNPALAYGGISGSPPSGAIASPGGMPDLGASFTAGSAMRNQANLQNATVANIQADTANKAAQGRLYEAQAAAAYGSADQAQAMTGQIGATVQRIKAEIPKINEETSNLQQQWQVLRGTAEMLAAQKTLMEQQGQTQTQVRNHLEAMISKLGTETALNQFDIDAAEKMGNMGRDMGQLKPFIDMITTVVRGLRGR